jgi:hypothetical protein
MIDIELGNDILKQVEVDNGPLPENRESDSIKFDAKGTLHLMCRDTDGKLLKDVPVKTIEHQKQYIYEKQEDYRVEHEEFLKTSRRQNILFYSLMGLVIVLLALCIVIIKGV